MSHVSYLFRGRNVLITAVSLMLLALMVVGVYKYRSPPETVSEQMLLPWGVMVVGYVFFAIMSGGIIDSAIIQSYILRDPHAADRLKRTAWTAMAVLVPGILLVFSDVLHPGKAAWFYLGFNPKSRIAWNALLYLIYAASLAALLIALIRGWAPGEQRTKLLAGITLVTSINLEMNLGLAFGMNIAVPAWYGVYTGIFFVLAAFVLGSSLELLTCSRKECATAGLRRMVLWEHLAAVASTAMIVFWSLLALYSWGLAQPLVGDIIKGYMSGYFWIGYVLPGFAIPAAITILHLLDARNTPSTTLLRTSGALAIIGIAMLLLVPFNYGGQALKLQENPMYATLAPYATQEPHIDPAEMLSEYLYSWEILAFIGAFGLATLLYMFGNALLPLNPGERPRRLLLLK